MGQIWDFLDQFEYMSQIISGWSSDASHIPRPARAGSPITTDAVYVDAKMDGCHSPYPIWLKATILLVLIDIA